MTGPRKNWEDWAFKVLDYKRIGDYSRSWETPSLTTVTNGKQKGRKDHHTHTHTHRAADLETND